MPAYTQTFKDLHWCALDPKQHAKTCGYWYVVTSYGSTPHTAFATRESFLLWAARLGLAIDAADVPQAGNHAYGRIAGEYRRVSHLDASDGFWALKGQRIRVMDNGDVTTGIVTVDDDGKRTVHHLNCNMPDRPKFTHDRSAVEGY